MSRLKSSNLPFLCFGLVVGLIVCTPSTAPAQSSLFKQLVAASEAEMAKKEGKLHVATEWNRRSEGLPILKVFQKQFPFVKHVEFTRQRGVATMQTIMLEAQQGKAPKFDILKVSSEAWSDYEKLGLFVKPPFEFHKLAKDLPPEWGEIDPRAIDPQGMFLATTGRAMGNAWNAELVPKGNEPTSWDSCLDPMWNGKFLYDPRPKLTGFWWDPKTREAHLKWLKGIVENGAVLNRGQTENLQKVAGGEFPLVCGVQYESAYRMIDRGAPLKFAFPDSFPMHFSTQFHVLKWSETRATTQLLALWLASAGQDKVDEFAYLGFPWNPKTKKYRLAKGKYVAVCDAECILRSEEYNTLHAEILNLPGVR